MNNRQLAVLLLVPAVAMAAKTRARRHQWAFDDSQGATAAEHMQGGHGPRHGHGPGARFGPRGGRGPWFARGARPFGGRVPPMMKAMLDEWHREAHGADADAGSDMDSEAAGEVRV